jgi:two-component system LytT family response regulator
VSLHVGGKELLYRSSLNELAENLDPMRFVRIYRSVIVSIESILQLELIAHGEFELVLRSGLGNRCNRCGRLELNGGDCRLYRM